MNRRTISLSDDEAYLIVKALETFAASRSNASQPVDLEMARRERTIAAELAGRVRVAS